MSRLIGESTAVIGGSDCEKRCVGSARTRKVNVTDPDSRTIKDGRGFVGGYRAQAAVAEDQIVVAAGVANAAQILASGLPGHGLLGADSPAFGQPGRSRLGA